MQVNVTGKGLVWRMVKEYLCPKGRGMGFRELRNPLELEGMKTLMCLCMFP